MLPDSEARCPATPFSFPAFVVFGTRKGLLMYGISIRRKKEPSGVPDASSCPAINNSERKFGAIADLRLIQDADVAILEEFGLLLQLLQNLTAAVDAIQFLAPGFAHLEEFFFLVDAQKTSAKEIGCNAGGAASGERVEYPGSWLCGGLNDSG